MDFLEGLNIKPHNNKTAKSLIGKRVKYLHEIDIDNSGRGYFFPKYGTVEEVKGREMCIDGSWVSISEVREMVEI